MTTLEKRISELESKRPVAVKEHKFVFFLDDESDVSAFKRAGVPRDYAGNIVRIQLVTPKHAEDNLATVRPEQTL